MNVAIITFTTEEKNYGALWQAYALKHYLEQNGCSVVLVMYDFRLNVTGVRRILGKNLHEQLRKICFYLRAIKFRKFRRRYLIEKEDIVKDLDTLGKICDKAELLICGSDQIWNSKYLKGLNDRAVAFLDFGPERVKRASFAASFGDIKPSEAFLLSAAKSLGRFTSISVREDYAGNYLHEYFNNKEVKHVCDPVLLLRKEQYEKAFDALSSRKKDLRKVVLLYMISEENCRLVKRVVDCTRYSINDVDYSVPSRALLRKEVLGPVDWLLAIKKAECVVTASYHAVLFCIIFHTKFVILRNSSAENTRIQSIVNALSLKSRVIEEADSHYLGERIEEEVDWKEIDRNVDAQRKNGMDFLYSIVTE